MTNRWMEWGNAELDRQFGLGGPEESMLFSFAVYKWLPKLLHQNSIYINSLHPDLDFTRNHHRREN